MSKKLQLVGWISLGVFVVAGLGLTGYYVATNEPSLPTTTASSQETNDEAIAEALEALIEEDEAGQESITGQATAALESLRDNGNEFGVATRVFNSVTNTFDIELIATLGDPQDGNVYVAQVSDGTTIVEIGQLNKEVENTFALSFSTDQNLESFDDIIVLETGSTQQNVLSGVLE